VRRAAKRDLIEQEIVALLRVNGWSVQPLSLKDGPDLLVGKCGRCWLVEVKTGNKRLRPGQVEWHADWRGSKVRVLRSVADAEAFVRDEL
jgi:hypothetical protein